MNGFTLTRRQVYDLVQRLIPHETGREPARIRIEKIRRQLVVEEIKPKRVETGR